jgi:hypothetical protein
VEVTSGGVTQTVEVSGGYGHMGMQHGSDAHFGLGATCGVEDLRVIRPGGAVEEWGTLQGNRVVAAESR